MSRTLPYHISEVQLIYKTKVKASERPKVTGSLDAYNILLTYWDENRIGFVEQAKILLLNRAHQVLGIYEISSGGVTSTIVDPKLVFTAALKANACAIILAHNHPSGNLKPSAADQQLTRKLAEGGRLLDISLLDHLIVTQESYFSFADELGM